MKIGEFSFEKFNNRNARIDDRVSIRKSYSVGFPTEFCGKNNLRQYEFVELFYDKEKKAIGMRFVSNETIDSTYSIMHSKTGYGASVVARSFFKTYNINPEEYHGKYSWDVYNLEDSSKLFVIQLEKHKTADGDKD